MGTPIVTRRSQSVLDTEAIAAELAASLRGGDCIALNGPLGAGKTQFVRGLARGLGASPRRVSSPTYVLLNIYDGGRLTLFHLDAYRVSGPGDFEEIGFSELLEQGGIVAVEWASRVEAILPPRRIEITMEPVDESVRLIQIERRGES
jgi:tRNA threonylcarbamoyladenosine biosynthesis protein TsaE